MPEKNKKVLIAEDEKAMAGVLAHKFNASGIQTLHVVNGVDAMANLKKDHFDLVILDLMMPEMDGFEVLRQMQQMNLKTPVIVLSNLGQTEDILKVRMYGAKEYLIKSTVSPAEILVHAKKYLN